MLGRVVRALVVDPANARAGLAAVRALASAGWSVGVGGTDPRGLAASSRRTLQLHPVPRPVAGADAFVAALCEAVSAGGYEILLPAGDEEALAVSRERERLPATVPYPPHALVERAFDKLSLNAAADRAGVRRPATTLVPPGEPFPDVPLPVIVKERVHSGAAGERPRIEAALALSREAGVRQLAGIHVSGADALVQEVVAGRLVAHASVTAPGGAMLAHVQQEAERLFPPGTGASARARTVAPDAAVTSLAGRLLRELGWSGIAQLQLLRDGAGEPCLIDFNGRFYGSLALAVAAGVNLPALWAAAATGRPAPPAGAARSGVRFQWLEGDLRVAAGERGVRLAAGLLGCAAYAAHARHGIWSARDPVPQLRHGGRLLRQEVPNLPRLMRKLTR
jgi:predicted ATP-grasp superfamily ATP-dependent carboligase